MAKYLYHCQFCGPFESSHAADVLQCRCGRQAKRRFAVQFNRSSLRPTEARWDPQVGEVVRSEREFQELLKAGVDRNSAELNMDCKVETVDARDTEALAELHGHSVDHRLEVAEQTAKTKHDQEVKV
jgi:hypothetical protein